MFYQAVSVGFFETMGMPIVDGRTLVSQDADHPVAIVNETLARRFFGGSAVGRRVGITKDSNAPQLAESDLIEIVGVARDAKYMTVREQGMPTVFVSGILPNAGAFAIRTAGDPHSVVRFIRSAAEQTSEMLTVSDFRTQSEQMSLTFSRERHFAVISSLFGVLTLLLTSIGIYGLLSYSVARRTQEIGIRIALGAPRWHVMLHVMREVVLLVLVGVAAGLAAASTTTRVIESSLFGLSSNDPLTIGLSMLLMIAMSLLAGLMPARRASNVDPIVALRYE